MHPPLSSFLAHCSRGTGSRGMMRSSAASLILVSLFVCSLLATAPRTATAQDGVPVVTRTYAITNARVVQAPGQVVEGATVVVRDGLILDVGSGVDVPFDAEVIEGDSLTVYAGFIDGLSHVGVDTPPTDTDVNVDRPGEPPSDRAGIKPDRNARGLLDPSDSAITSLREAGFTTAHVVPEGQMLPGTGVIIQLGGDDANAMLLRDGASMYMQHTGAIGSYPNVIYPSTPMAVIAKMRQMYREAERRAELADAYASNPRGRQRPPSDPVHDAFTPVLEGDLPMAIYAENVLELHRSLALQSELGFPMILAGLNESFQAMDALSNADAPLFLTLDLPEPPDDAVEDTTDSDAGVATGDFFQTDLRIRTYEDVDAETENLRARQAVEREKYYATAAMLHEAGLQFGFTTRDVKAGDVHENLRTMIENGLPEDAALAALTTDAASLLGLSDQLGSVESGKIANLVVADGSIFDEDTKMTHIFVDGTPYEIETGEPAEVEEDAASLLVGEWQYTIESPQGALGGTLTFTGEGSDIEGEIASPTSDESRDVKSISFDGENLSFEFDGGEAGAISVTVTVDGDSFDGSVSTPQFGSFPISGSKTSSPE